MIELERHIEALLLENDCVIVPNFGGFMAHHVCAYYEDAGQLFYPPLRTIGFNPQLTINDSLLAQSYVDVYDISYPEALRRIEQEVTEMKQHLANEGQFELSDIGTIYYNNEGTYAFTPCEAGVLTPELYGLGALEIAPLSAATSNTVHISQDDNKRLSNNIGNGIDNSTKNVKIAEEPTLSPLSASGTLADEDEDRGKTIQIRMSVVRNLAAACLVAVAFFLFPSPLENQRSSAKMFGNIDTSLLYKIMPREVTTGMRSIKHDTARNISHTGMRHETRQATPIPKDRIEQYYSIVLASKVTVKNASAFVERLHQNGYQLARVYTKNKSTKVVYGRYETEQAAYNALNDLHQQKQFADGWVLKITSAANQ